MTDLKPEDIRPDCPRCFGIGKIGVLNSLSGAVSQQELIDCWVCKKAAEKKEKKS